MKRKPAPRWVFLCLGLTFFISILCFLSLNLFTVKTIYIVGPRYAIIDYSSLQKKQNVLLISAKKLQAALQVTNPYVLNASTYKLLPQTLRIEVVVREPILEYAPVTRTVLIDQFGKLLPVIPQFSTAHLPRLSCLLSQSNPGDTIKNETLLFGLEVFAAVQKSIGNSRLLACNPDGTTLTLEFEQTKIIFAKTGSVDEIISSLQYLFKQFRIEGKWPETVDLRFQKPVLIPKGLPLTTTDSSTPSE